MTNQNIADSVIKIFFEVGIDGETMEYIIDKMGMREQMIKQLVTNKQELELEQNGPVFTLTKQQIIEFTRDIQERALEAAKAAIEGTGGDFDQYVELELNCDINGNYIKINVDEDGILGEVVDNVRDVFETDDDSVYDEVLNVLENISQPKI